MATKQSKEGKIQREVEKWLTSMIGVVRSSDLLN